MYDIKGYFQLEQLKAVLVYLSKSSIIKIYLGLGGITVYLFITIYFYTRF